MVQCAWCGFLMNATRRPVGRARPLMGGSPTACARSVGAPARRWVVRLASALASQVAMSDDAGRFAFDGVEDGPCEITDGDGRLLLEGTVEGEPVEVEIEVR